MRFSNEMNLIFINFHKILMSLRVIFTYKNSDITYSQIFHLSHLLQLAFGKYTHLFKDKIINFKTLNITKIIYHH